MQVYPQPRSNWGAFGDSASQILLCLEIFVFKYIVKKYISPLKMYFAPKSWNLATGLLIAANEANFCCHNKGHFLCGVERIKRLVNIHLHCIVRSGICIALSEVA